MKEHGVGKRKSSYTFEQLEQVFGQGGWDAQPCQPVLINSSGLYQELESDGSTMEEYSQEDWGNHSQDLHGYPTDQELGKKAAIYATLMCVYIYLYMCTGTSTDTTVSTRHIAVYLEHVGALGSFVQGASWPHGFGNESWGAPLHEAGVGRRAAGKLPTWACGETLAQPHCRQEEKEAKDKIERGIVRIFIRYFDFLKCAEKQRRDLFI